MMCLSQKKLSQSSVLLTEESGGDIYTAPGINILQLVIHPPPLVQSIVVHGLPLGGTLNYFCNILSLYKKEHQVRNQKPGGNQLLSRAAYIALLWITDKTQGTRFQGPEHSKMHKNHIEWRFICF
jgi:hypothetical protein